MLFLKVMINENIAREKRAHFLLGVFVNGGMKNDKDGILYFERKTREDPQDAEAYAGLGACYFNLREYDKAVSEYERAVQLNPNSKALRDQLSLVYRMRERKRGR